MNQKRTIQYYRQKSRFREEKTDGIYPKPQSVLLQTVEAMGLALMEEGLMVQGGPVKDLVVSKNSATRKVEIVFILDESLESQSAEHFPMRIARLASEVRVRLNRHMPAEFHYLFEDQFSVLQEVYPKRVFMSWPKPQTAS